MGGQRWEYAVITFQSVYVDGEWKWSAEFTGPDGKPKDIEAWVAGSAIPILNQLGAEGWELVEVETRNAILNHEKLANGYVYPTASPMNRAFWLKRPILA